MRQPKPHRQPVTKEVQTEAEKQQYLVEAKSFADSLVANLGDSYGLYNWIFLTRSSFKNIFVMATITIGHFIEKSEMVRNSSKSNFGNLFLVVNFVKIKRRY